MTQVALKEWAAVEDALAHGRISVLVRKGGIDEQRGAFRVQHRAFWLFPTGWHQNEHELAPALRGHLQDTPRFAPGEVPLRVHCEVADAFRVTGLDAVQRLAELQPFSGGTLEARFHYRQRPWLHVLVLRAALLEPPWLLANRAAYDGCVSWVELERPYSPAAATPLLGDAAFAALRREVRGRLGDAAQPV